MIRIPRLLPACALAASFAAASSGAMALVERPPAAVLGPAAALDQVRQLNVLIVVYTRSFARTLTAAEIERLQEEIVEFADFYQQHGGNRVAFRFTLLQLDRMLRREEVSEVSTGRYYLSRENVEAELDALGMRGRFDEVVAFYAWSNANPENAQLAYGGGAVGPDGGFLGDAGFNSIGVFAWDPGRIAQIAVHEVLHNVDDMFSRSGQADAFFNSDEMSRNLPQLLRERPGAFLPYFTDRDMLAYALREQAGREQYPWWMQRIYYAWMLERTPASAWSALQYGRMVTAQPPSRPRALYDEVYLSRATPAVYLPVLGARGTVRARAGAATITLAARRYALEDFDGTPLVERPYHAGWVQLPHADSAVNVRFSAAAPARIIRLRLGDVIAPERVLAWSDSGGASFAATVVEAGWPQRGDTIPARLVLELPGRTIAPVQSSGGVHRFADLRGQLRGTLLASAPWFWIAPAPVAVSAASTWTVHAPRSVEGGMASPLDVRLELRDDRPLEGSLTATLEGRGFPLERLPDGGYHAYLERLPPGLHRLLIYARRNPVINRDTVLVYGRPTGWIRTPAALTGAPGTSVPLEVTVRSRMGEALRGLGLPLVAIAGHRVAPLREDSARPGTYRADVVLPRAGEPVVVTSLEGDFQRRVIVVDTGRARRRLPAATPLQSDSPAPLRGADGPLAYTAAVHLPSPPHLDGDIAEWDGPPLLIGAGSYVLTDSTAYHGDADAAAAFWFAWDDSTLYLAGRVRDDTVTVGEAWDRDRVNLVFDWRENDTPLTYGEDGQADVPEWQPDDHWLFFQPFWSEHTPGVPRRMDRAGTTALAQARLAARRTADGYTFELAVPASALPEYVPFAGHVAALQVFLTDGDGSTASELMWSHRWGWSAAGGLSWELARMGRLVFVGDR